MQSLRNEFINAAKLFRLKLKDARNGIIIILVANATLVAANTVFVWRGFTASSNSLTSQHFMDYSVLVLVVAPLIVAFVFFQEFRGSNSVYPQTSVSRFLAVQALSLSLVVLALCVVLVLYLLIMAASLLISLWQSSFILGYSFSPVYLATGFLAALAFLVMVTTTIAFSTFAVRSFKLFAAIPIAAVPVFYILFPVSWNQQAAGIDWLRMQIERVAVLFFDPRSFGSFLLACLAVIIALLAVGIILKSVTPHGKDSRGESWMLAIAFTPYVALTLFIGLSMYMGMGFGQTHVPYSAAEILPREAQVITLDASHVAEGSRVMVIERTHNRETLEMGDYIFLGTSMPAEGLVWHGANTEEQIVVIDYTPANFEFSSNALRELARPELSARLDDDVLYIEHSFEGQGNVLFVPIWSMMGMIMENQLDMNPQTYVDAEWGSANR
ncbi:MAG: hypothetical protein FWD93_01110 [Coriobacteriia bacterium]|nr:hypothetical protein [Coriobacteriia bacterium]